MYVSVHCAAGNFSSWQQLGDGVGRLEVFALNQREIGSEGWVVLPNGRTCLCSIRDLKEAGLEINMIGSHPPLPQRFELSCLTSALTFPVSLRAQRGSAYGVEIIGKARLSRSR